MVRVWGICATAWVVFLLGSIPAASQSLNSVQGKVTDPGGAAIPNATVHLTNAADNSGRVATTDASGLYRFSDVAPGTYRLRVEAPGFEELEENDLVLTANSPKIPEVKLQIKQVQQNVTVRSQEGDECLAPQARVLPGVGPGLRALRTGPSGDYYVLTAPGTSVAIYSPDGKAIGQVPAGSSPSSPGSSIINGVDLQVDSTGRVYVADATANAIKIYSAQGALEKTIRVPGPVSVEPLPGGEVAVASLFSKHLADVYDEERGEVYRSIGEDAQVVVECDQSSLTCTVPKAAKPASNSDPAASRVWFYGDSAGNLYINLPDSSSPTVRKYDSYGYLAYESTVPLVRSAPGKNSGWSINPDVRLANIGTVGLAADGSQSYSTTSLSANSSSSSADGTTPGTRSMFGGGEMRGMGGGGGEGMHGGGGGMRGGGAGGEGQMQFGLRITDRVGIPESKPKIEAIGVDTANEEMWAAIGGLLVHFDKEGSLAGYYCLSTTDQAALKPATIVVEPSRILVGTDPFGVFQYPRPDKPSPEAATSH